MHPEDKATQHIDRQLPQAGWLVQDHRRINHSAGPGNAVPEFPRKTGAPNRARPASEGIDVHAGAESLARVSGYGGTATPTAQTIGFFNGNVLQDYSHEKAVADGVNDGYDVYRIDTQVTSGGATPTFPYDGLPSPSKTTVFEGRGTRDRRTRKTLYRELHDDLTYTANQLDLDLVNRDQLRLVIRTFRDRLFTESGPTFLRPLFPTPYSLLPTQCLLFMRNINSASYFEQMKRCGCRIVSSDDLQGGWPSYATYFEHRD